MKVERLPDGITRILFLIEDPDDTHDTAIVAYVRRVPKRRLGREPAALPGRR